MPSPFKRHGASRQIQPMSQAELDASLAELEAKAEDEHGQGVYITRGSGENNWLIKYQLENPMRHLTIEGHEPQGLSREEAERFARRRAQDGGFPYIGER